MGIKKTPKGDISIENFRGRIRLRWRTNGERFSFNLPFAYLPENLPHAAIKVAEIRLDIMKGCFDSSLRKYQPPTIAKAIPPPIKQEEPPVEAPKELFLQELAPKFTEWGKNIRNVEVDQSIDYLYTRRLLEKWVGIPIIHIAEKLNDEDWAVTTYNRRLGYLNIFFTWLVDNGIISFNPLKNVCKRRNKGKKRNPRRKPLEESEIMALLDAIKNNTYCPKAARFNHSHYYPFLAFIFYTGVRNAEAIGLKVKHINFDLGHIEISETFARTVKGSHHAARISKGTKTENIRYLPLTDELKELLKSQIENKQPEEFVFKSPKGLSINDHMFERRILKPVLKKMDLGNRDLYSARHGFGTRGVQQGMALTDVAYLMGHSNVETAMRNYVSVERPATILPTISKQEVNNGITLKETTNE